MNRLVEILSCILPLFLVVAAHDHCCKVDGGLTEWTQFTPCSASCGPGTQKRERFCAAPYARHGGKDCTGPLKDTKDCNLGDCPRDGGWTDWKETPCSKSCGGGTFEEVRTCTNPSPSKCGKDCVGPSKRTPSPNTCNLHECPKPKKYCDKCEWFKNGDCNKRCWLRCFYKGKFVDDSLCPGMGLGAHLQPCYPSQCPPRYEWDYVCEEDLNKVTCSGSLKKCIQKCPQKCINIATKEVVNDGKCKGPKPDIKERKCPIKDPKKLNQFCPSDPEINQCLDCKQKALDKAKTFKDPYWKANFPGDACRDSEVQANLWEYCKKNKDKQSINGGLPANDWFWVHCSADGPWCKPCNPKTLEFSSKCDACEVSRDVKKCSGPHKG